MPMNQDDKVRLSLAVQSNIRAFGWRAVEEYGAEKMLEALLDPHNHRNTLAKCQTPQAKEEVKKRFQALADNQAEALLIIKNLLSQEHKRQEHSSESYSSSEATEKDDTEKEQH